MRGRRVREGRWWKTLLRQGLPEIADRVAPLLAAEQGFLTGALS